MYVEVLLSGLAIMLTSLSGKLVMWGTFGKYIQKSLKYFVTLALGVFSITLFLMFSELKEFSLPLTQTIIAILLGAGLLEVLQRLIPDAHHHHGTNREECCETCDCKPSSEHKHTINPKRILLGDAIHNIGDGIALVPAYLISWEAGLVLTIGIVLHEFVQETSEFFLLKEAGYSTRKALLSNFIVQSSIFTGIIFSLIVATATTFAPLLIAFSVGALAYIILRDLLPHTLERIKHGGGLIKHLLAYTIGFIIMLAITSLLPR